MKSDVFYGPLLERSGSDFKDKGRKSRFLGSASLAQKWGVYAFLSNAENVVSGVISADIVLKDTDEMIGQAGLTMQPYKNTKVLEIGYLLKEKFWHLGYAREAAMECKKYAFEKLNQDKVCSIIKADNLASMRVAESIGMSKEDEFITQYYNGDNVITRFINLRRFPCISEKKLQQIMRPYIPL